MKNFIKNKIREQLMDEDYPSTWSIEEFKKLNSFAARIKFCEDHLQRISSGSSRIVYKIDDEKVLKLAKNKKGLAQNEIEATYSNYHDISDITAKVFEYDDDNLWVEMELARKVTAPIFKQIIGYSFDDYCAALYNHYSENNQDKKRGKKSVDPEIVKQMWETEFTYDMLSFIGNYNIPVGDLMRLNSYGLIHRDGNEQILLIDYGLDNNVWESYY